MKSKRTIQRQKEQKERNKKIYKAYVMGNRTYENIGLEYGITRERVRQIIEQIEKEFVTTE